MKVLHIINNLTVGGAEQLLIETLEVLKNTEVELSILLISKVPSPLKSKLKEYPSLNWIEFDTTSPYNPLVFLKLLKFFKNTRFNIIHLHLLPTLYWAILAAKVSRVSAKICYTEHCPILAKRKNCIIRKIDTLIYKRLDGIISISQSTAQSISDHLKPCVLKKVTVITNGIDLKKFEKIKAAQRKVFGLLPTDFLCIQVSSFKPPKDHKTLLKAFKMLPKGFKLLLAGDGHLRREIEALCAQLGLQDQVLFLGNRNDIPQLLAMSDVFILSTHFEGCSLAVIEAMVSGRPVILSNVPGIYELVGEYGFLFEQGDASQLATIILDLSKNANKHHEMFANQVMHANKFSIESYGAKLLDYYKKL